MDYDHVKKQLGYGIQTESKDNAIKAIEQLTARVRELEEALEGYRANRKEDMEMQVQQHKYIISLQAYAEQLREALETLNKVSNIGCDRVEKALALPRDASALDAYVAERVKELQERLSKALAVLGADTQIEAEAVMRNYKNQIATLTRQRDLAVEALAHTTPQSERK